MVPKKKQERRNLEVFCNISTKWKSIYCRCWQLRTSYKLPREFISWRDFSALELDRILVIAQLDEIHPKLVSALLKSALAIEIK